MLVKVHNLNIHPYREKFRERLVEIPAGEFIEMDEDEADYFAQTFTYPKKDSQGRPDPLYFKKLKIEKPKIDKPADNLICHANGQKALTQSELAQVLGNFSHMLADKDESAEAEILKKQNAVLKKDNKELAQKIERQQSEIDMIKEKLGLRTDAHAENL